ncbi:MAG: hypothetical protein KJ587_19860 [Alphaproteobacteria bacterium]|nr:hypothetical protein [Alphaproteobacteria bacterium]
MSKTKETYWPNGQMKSRISYNDNGQRHGPYEAWYEDGQQWEKSNYNNGQRHGPYEAWHKNGQQWEKINCYHGNKGQSTSHKFQVGHLVSYVHDNKECIDCIVKKIEQYGYVMSSGHFVVEQNIKGIDK